MAQQTEQTRPVFGEGVPKRSGRGRRNEDRIAAENQPLADQQRHNCFQHVAQDHHKGQRPAEGAEEIGQAGVAAAVVPHVIPQNILGDDDRPVETAAKVGEYRRDAQQQRQRRAVWKDALHGQSSLSPFSRMDRMMGVPSSRKVERMQFSRYR